MMDTSRSELSRAGDLPDRLLAWYDRHRRRLPWRAPPGRKPDPYAVWLSEIMLQQTTVAAVDAYFRRFLERWPTVRDLAAAPLDDVLRAWQGLGYYARARNLHKCAGIVAGELGGRFPETESGLRQLPGIGPYTAAAIAAIAFDHRAVVVDGNVERVIARLYRLETPLPDCKPEIRALADVLTPERRSGDYAQAVMDLGATVCTVASPKCMLCPWSGECAGISVARDLPRRRPKKAKPLRRGVAFWLVRDDGAVLLRRRPPEGLLGGMMEVPSTEWRPDEIPDPDTAVGESPLRPGGCRVLAGIVRHGFTHFDLELTVIAGRVNGRAPNDCVWCLPDAFGDHALPTVMKKVVRHALAQQ